MFCTDLQGLLTPIYDLARKGRPFLWTEVQRKAFEEIKKKRLLKPQIPHLLDNKGRFQLFSDTSKTSTGAALYQNQG